MESVLFTAKKSRCQLLPFLTTKNNGKNETKETHRVTTLFFLLRFFVCFRRFTFHFGRTFEANLRTPNKLL